MKDALVCVLCGVLLTVSCGARAQDGRVFTVTTAEDSGPGSLRTAITHANANPGRDFIHFSIGTGRQTIRPLSQLPSITDPVVIDGSTQPGYGEDITPGTAGNGTGGKPLITPPAIALDGSLIAKDALTNGAGILVRADHVTVKALGIHSFKANGLMVDGAQNFIAESNYCGVDLSGSIAKPNSSIGIILIGSSNSKIVGNVISGNLLFGLTIFAAPGKNHDRDVATLPHDIVVRGNLVGVSADGARAVANRAGGILVQYGRRVVIGGSKPEERNIISGNVRYGVNLSGDLGRDNRISGNFIGTDATGTFAIPNTRTGIVIFNTGNNIIGGSKPGEGNLISGNKRGGVNLDGSATRPEDPSGTPGGRGATRGNRVIGNLIGTDVSGLKPLPNGLHGIIIFMAQKNFIGGKGPGERNIISGNTRDGIFVAGPNPKQPDWREAARNWLTKNKDIVITSPLPRGDPKAMQALEVSKNAIVGNYIGVGIDGKTAVANGRYGVLIAFSPDNLIGSNVISFNGRAGIRIGGARSGKNRIVKNFIGRLKDNGTRALNKGGQQISIARVVREAAIVEGNSIAKRH